MRINVVCEDGLRLDAFFPKSENVKLSRLNSQIAVNKLNEQLFGRYDIKTMQ